MNTGTRIFVRYMDDPTLWPLDGKTVDGSLYADGFPKTGQVAVFFVEHNCEAWAWAPDMPVHIRPNHGLQLVMHPNEQLRRAFNDCREMRITLTRAQEAATELRQELQTVRARADFAVTRIS